MKSKKDANAIIAALEQEYPDALCTLDFGKDYELLFATRLAAQCTDARVNQITPTLYARFPTLESLAEADIEELEQIIHSCGFFHSKARDIKNAASMLITRYGGKVPGTMEELLELPGVGRKTANIILGDVYGLPAVVTDTHCIRIANKLGMANTKAPEKVEAQLREQLPPEKSSDFCHRLVLHGRAVCGARSPRCGDCCISAWCDTYLNV